MFLTCCIKFFKITVYVLFDKIESELDVTVQFGHTARVGIADNSLIDLTALLGGQSLESLGPFDIEYERRSGFHNNGL